MVNMRRVKQFLYDFYETPRYVFDWNRVWIHCLRKFHLNFKGEDHRMCKINISDSRKPFLTKYFFCSCGHMVSEMPEDVQDFATLINKLGPEGLFKEDK